MLRILRPFPILLLLLGTPARSEPPGYAPHRVLLRFRDGGTLQAKGTSLAAVGVSVDHVYRVPGLMLVEDPSRDALSLAQSLAQRSDVLYAEPDYEVAAAVLPNDPALTVQYGLFGPSGEGPGPGISAVLAWDIAVGDTIIPVGVIDTGIDLTHPDLVENLWTNPGEIPGNGIDDDGNGYVDDVHGYDFFNHDGDPSDDNLHGTHVAGIIAGRGNNGIGIAGTCWRGRLVALKFLNDRGSGFVSGAIEALEYAERMGVRIANNSWGGAGFSNALRDAITIADGDGLLFVAAAGNYQTDLDQAGFYPASYQLPNIISVAATDSSGQLAYFSNYGAGSVDLAAPGDGIMSTIPHAAYAYLSGTSMATPFVSGAAALVWNMLPHLSHHDIRDLLLAGVDPLPSLQGKVITGGRLNVYRTLAERDTVPPPPIQDLAASDVRSTTLQLSWTATGDPVPPRPAVRYEVRADTLPLDLARWPQATVVVGAPRPEAAGTPQGFEVQNLPLNRDVFLAVRVIDPAGNASPLSNVVEAHMQGTPAMLVSTDTTAFDLAVDDSAFQTVRVRNTGDGDLLLEVERPSLSLGASAFPGALATGGPDAFGYRFGDSDEPGAPAFQWIDLSGGTPVDLRGDNVVTPPLPIGFDFPFYGRFQSSVRICSNGFLSFSNAATNAVNLAFPGEGPSNCVAAFWDDLDLGAGGHVYMQSDLSRCVIAWVGVPRRGGGGNYTFELILYPTGDIAFQYLTLGSIRNSATVGIQNQLRDIGLTVAFNRDALHDNLAIYIERIPQWLDVSPDRVHVAPGDSVGLVLRARAAGLRTGDFFARAVLRSNDPAQPATELPARLHARGFPQLALSAPALDFGTLFTGDSVARSLTLFNTGSDRLVVDAIESSAPELVPAAEGLQIPAGAARRLGVSLTPAVSGAFQGEIRVHSDDAAQPVVVVPTTANVLPAPRLTLSADTLRATLVADTSLSTPVTLANDGGSPLSWHAELVVVPDTLDVQFSRIGDAVTADAHAGGPDRFGHRWRDSIDPRGPVYQWVEISGFGTPLALGDEDAVAIGVPVGFPFRFYGNTFTTVNVSVNGWLSFTDVRQASVHGHLPGPSGLPNMIAPFWDDLSLTPVSRVYAYSDGGHMIIEWQDVEQLLDPGYPFTFEVVLGADGSILYQYQRVGRMARSCTVGIQNDATDDGLEIAIDVPYVHDGLAVRISDAPDWLLGGPLAGTIPSGVSQSIALTLDTHGLAGGAYRGVLRLFSNAPASRRIEVPIRLEVEGAPRIAVEAAALDLGTSFSDDSVKKVVLVRNLGTAELRLYTARTGSPRFRAQGAGARLAPGLVLPLEVWFRPGEVGSFADTLTLTSNDADSPQSSVALRGAGVEPPPLRAAPDTVISAVTALRSRDRSITLRNSTNANVRVRVRAWSAPEPAPPGAGVAGADRFGYRWLDPTNPASPAVTWIGGQSASNRLPLPAVSDLSDSLGLGFAFPFYGDTFTAVRVAAAGYVTFARDPVATRPVTLPSKAGPASVIAVLWSDWAPAEPHVHWQRGRDSVVVSWLGMISAPGGDPASFQLVLRRGGTWRIRYGDGSVQPGALVGAQDARGEEGLAVAPPVQAPWSLVAAADRYWLRPPRGELAVPAHAHIDLPLVLAPPRMPIGDYIGTLSVEAVDGSGFTATATAQLHASGLPDLLAEPNALVYGGLMVGDQAVRTYTVANVGEDTLVVHTFYSTSDDFTADAAELVIPPGARHDVSVRYHPREIGSAEAMLWMLSNDLQPFIYGIALLGTGLPAPRVESGPDSLQPFTLRGDSTLEVPRLFLVNQGFVPLVWSMETREAAGGGPAPWVSAVPETGSVPSHQQQVIRLHLDTHGLQSGLHQARVAVRTNDPLGRAREWGLSVSVPSAGAIASSGPVGFGTGYTGDTLTMPVAFVNGGEGPVYLRGARTGSAAFIPPAEAWPFKLAAGARDTLWVRFAPQGACACMDTLALLTDQADSVVRVVLSGTGAGDAPPRELRFALAGPNPSSVVSVLALDLPRSGPVEVVLFDVRGARVRVLAGGPLPAGRYRLEWDGRDGGGRTLPSGVYFARMNALGEERRVKLVRLN